MVTKPHGAAATWENTRRRATRDRLWLITVATLADHASREESPHRQEQS